LDLHFLKFLLSDHFDQDDFFYIESSTIAHFFLASVSAEKLPWFPSFSLDMELQKDGITSTFNATFDTDRELFRHRPHLMHS